MPNCHFRNISHKRKKGRLIAHILCLFMDFGMTVWRLGLESPFFIPYFLLNMINCKFCGGQINDEAIKCQHCGEFQDPKYKWKGVQVKPSLFQKVFCTHCYHTGSPKTITKWSIFLELLLWCMIIPWMIYSWYRAKSRYCICAKCGSNQINSL